MPPQTCHRILYVEDEEDIRCITKIALEEIGGFILTLCKNGREAIDAAKEFTPDLLLLDVMMPDMDGIMTLAELRKLPHLQTVPVIFMTAKVQLDEVMEYKKLGVIDVIMKPFDPITIADHIKTVFMDYYGH